MTFEAYNDVEMQTAHIHKKIHLRKTYQDRKEAYKAGQIDGEQRSFPKLRNEIDNLRLMILKLRCCGNCSKNGKCEKSECVNLSEWKLSSE